MAQRITASAEKMLSFLAKQAQRKMPLFSTLATMEDGVACARTVVIRQVDAEAGTLWISTHGKAEKVRHLRAQPIAELVVWLPEQRMQARLRAMWRVIDAAAAGRTSKLAAIRTAAWLTHSEKSRTMFTWPAPGRPMTPRLARQLRETPSAALFADSPPADFAVLLGTLQRIDALAIGDDLHQRYLHERVRQKWRTTAITP